MADTVNITINGNEHHVPAGQNLLKTALDLGYSIPHFCWHEKLKVDGNCRMCVVEVKPGPDKPQLACTLTVADGMEIVTESEQLAKQRTANLEFLLLNHPLDCPICDKSNECPLQDYTYRYGQAKSWMFDAGLHSEKRRYPRKDISDKIFIEMDRCIHCTRCVRYFDEKVGFAGFGRTLRNHQMRIDAYPGLPANNFELNSTDICPVGALGEKNFRFKERVWDLYNRPSICSGCSVGCNTLIGSADGSIRRMIPRRNDNVNSVWMCDRGRLNFGHVNAENRGASPLVLQQAGVHARTSWEEAVSAAAQALKTAHATAPESVGVYISPFLTNEDIFLARRMCETLLPGSKYGTIMGLNRLPVLDVDSDILPKTLASEDHTPNTNGTIKLGIPGGRMVDYLKEVVEAIEAGTLKVLMVLGEDLMSIKRGPGLKEPTVISRNRLSEALRKLDVLIVADLFADSQTSQLSSVYLPTVSSYEKSGSFVNRQAMVQSFDAAVTRADLPLAKEDLSVLNLLWHALDPAWKEKSLAEVRAMMNAEDPVFATVDWDTVMIGETPVFLSEDDWALKAQAEAMKKTTE